MRICITPGRNCRCVPCACREYGCFCPTLCGHFRSASADSTDDSPLFGHPPLSHTHPHTHIHRGGSSTFCASTRRCLRTPSPPPLLTAAAAAPTHCMRSCWRGPTCARPTLGWSGACTAGRWAARPATGAGAGVRGCCGCCYRARSSPLLHSTSLSFSGSGWF